MKITVATGNPTPKIESWEVESALNTLVKAREIRQDPEMMKLVSKLAKKQQSAIKDIADVKSAYNRMVDLKKPVVAQEPDDLNDNPEDQALEAMIQADE